MYNPSDLYYKSSIFESIILFFFLFLLKIMEVVFDEISITLGMSNDTLIMSLIRGDVPNEIDYNFDMLNSRNNGRRIYPIYALIQQCHKFSAETWIEIYGKMDMIRPIAILHKSEKCPDPSLFFIKHSGELDDKNFARMIEFLLQRQVFDLNSIFLILLKENRLSKLRILTQQISRWNSNMSKKLELKRWRKLHRF